MKSEKLVYSTPNSAKSWMQPSEFCVRTGGHTRIEVGFVATLTVTHPLDGLAYVV
jgi:hypothetical protein